MLLRLGIKLSSASSSNWKLKLQRKFIYFAIWINNLIVFKQRTLSILDDKRQIPVELVSIWSASCQLTGNLLSSFEWFVSLELKNP